MVGKKEEKISRFLKSKYPWYDSYIIVLPILRGSQKYKFHPHCLTWRARRVHTTYFYVSFQTTQSLFLLFYILSNLYLFTYSIVTMTTIILHYERIKCSIMTLAECHHLRIQQRWLLFHCHNRVFHLLINETSRGFQR